MSAADATAAVDVGKVRRERDVAIAALRRIDGAGSLADARHLARRALLALLGDPATDALHEALARDSAALIDPMELAR